MKYILVILLMVSSCYARTCAMSRNDFDCIQIGDTLDKVEQTVGEPYRICSKGGDTYEYEYVIKLQFTGKSDTTIEHYYIIVSKGVVVGKRFSSESSPAYNLIYSDDPNDYSY